MAALPVIWMLAGLLALLVAVLGIVTIRSDAGAASTIGVASIWKGLQLVWAIAIIALLLGFALYLLLVEKGVA